MDKKWGGEISSSENLEKIKYILENKGSIIIEHWILRGATTPNRIVFDSFDDFIDYLKKDKIIIQVL